MEIRFLEHKIAGYASRTIENVNASDLTIAFALDPNSHGERLTRNTAGEKYCGILLKELVDGSLSIGGNSSIIKVVEALHIHDPLVLNIAGNGLYHFNCEQSRIDQEIEDFLTECFGKCEFIPPVIRNGGQTGIDEASLKAARFLGIQPVCLAPKGWVFRNRHGQDIADEKLFKERFKK